MSAASRKLISGTWAAPDRCRRLAPAGHPAAARLQIANITQVRDQLIAHGHATPGEIEAHLAVVAAGRLDPTTSPLVAAWARRKTSPG
ncbi:MAG: hypothetical protein ACRDOD_01715 [Streptosporangiaceae bacterium]